MGYTINWYTNYCRTNQLARGAVVSKKPENEGLSLLYRIRWRLTWLLLHVFGPADLPDQIDPRRRMERERAARVASARAKAA
jgi:hypothetical protein